VLSSPKRFYVHISGDVTTSLKTSILTCMIANIFNTMSLKDILNKSFIVFLQGKPLYGLAFGSHLVTVLAALLL
jgi:hypothetical protein